MSHTPALPLRFNEDSNEIVDKNGDFIVDINGITGLTIESANYIVRTCNSHGELLKILKMIDKTLIKMIRKEAINVDKDFINMRTNYLAAIVKAESK